MESESSNLDHSEVKIEQSYTGAPYLVAKKCFTAFNTFYVISGSVWVYGTWAKVHANTYIPCPKVNATLMNATAGCTPGTCNDMLLKFSFAMVTIDWTLYGLIIVLIGGMIVRACAKVKRQQYEKF